MNAFDSRELLLSYADLMSGRLPRSNFAPPHPLVPSLPASTGPQCPARVSPHKKRCLANFLNQSHGSTPFSLGPACSSACEIPSVVNANGQSQQDSFHFSSVVSSAAILAAALAPASIFSAAPTFAGSQLAGNAFSSCSFTSAAKPSSFCQVCQDVAAGYVR